MSRRLPNLAALLLAAALSASCGPGEKPARVVLVTFDTLRADRLDGPDAAMPVLAAAARKGTVFTDFYAATSSTQPTHATLFTGLHPWQHGVPRNGAVLPEAIPTLAERLREAGFHTAAAVGSFPLEARFGFSQGFDVYLDDFDRTDRSTDRVWGGEQVEGGFYNLAGRVVQRGLRLLDEAPDGDHFLWLHLYDPHSPYGDLGAPERMLVLAQILAAIQRDPSHAAGLIELGLGLYDRDVEAMDAALAPLLERLEEDAERFETHVLLTSDHGESFGEENSMGHGKRVIRSQVHVPLIVLSPRMEPGRRDDTAGSVDVPATILAAVGLPPLPGSQGRDLARPPAEPRNLFGMRRTFAKPYEDVRADGSVVVVDGHRFFAARDGRLYIGDAEGIEVEGGGSGELSEDELRALFRTFSAELEGMAVDERVDAATQEALRNLGYER